MITYRSLNVVSFNIFFFSFMFWNDRQSFRLISGFLIRNSTFSYVFLVLTFFLFKAAGFFGGGDSSNTRLQHALIHESLEQAHFWSFELIFFDKYISLIPKNNFRVHLFEVWISYWPFKLNFNFDRWVKTQANLFLLQ